MYLITCCRIGNKSNINYKGKGAFTKSFKSLEELVGFIVRNEKWAYFPNLKKELSKSDMQIVAIKYNSLRNAK